MIARDKPMVSVGVPTLGRTEVLLDTLGYLLKQKYDNFEIIVADQTAIREDSFIKDLCQLSKKIRYYRIGPPNLPAARNYIANKARGTIVLFIDDDMVLRPNFIAAHVKEHIARPEISVVAGRIIQENLPLSKKPLYFNRYGLPQGTFNCPSSGPCSMLPGGNHSLPVKLIRELGGYHTAYKKDSVREESDMGHRIIKKGYKMYYSADAAAVHLSADHGGTRIFKPQFDNYRFYVNDLLFMFRTVKIYNLPYAIFKRLRIYSGGGSLTQRFRRTGIFVAGFATALCYLVFQRKNINAKEL